MNHQAIYNTHPAVKSIRGTDCFDADGNPVAITQSLVDAEVARLQAEYDSKAYARARATAYPSVSDFMEAYTEKEIGGSSTKWDAYVTAYNKVRTDNPK
ncbi:MAG: hypothetical protein CBC24_07460, partial [Candidatus Pelagibacter sp. TMED64]